MRNIGLRARMGLAAGVILLTYAVIMNYVLAILFNGASLSDPFWIFILTVTTCIAVTLTYIAGISSIIGSLENMLTTDESPELSRRAQELSDKMGIERPDIGFEKMGTPNAYAVGRRNKGYVVLSVELLETFTVDEIEAVMAHEFAHLRNRDSVITVVGTTITNISGWIIHAAGLAVGFISYIIIKALRKWSGKPYYPGFPPHQQARIKQLAGSVRDVVTGFITIFIRTLSRQREFIADETAVRFTGNPAAMQSALQKIGHASSDSQSRRSQQAGEQIDETGSVDVPNALCIHSEFSGALDQLFKTHPSIDERVSRLDTVYSGDSSDSSATHRGQARSGARASHGRTSTSATASARGTVVSGTTNGRASIRTDLAADGVFHLSNVDVDLSVGDDVRLTYPDSVNDPSASDITDVQPLDENVEPDTSSHVGIVESISETRVAVRSNLADDGVLYLSGVQVDLSPGDRVRLYYPQTEPNPTAGDITDIRPINHR